MDAQLAYRLKRQRLSDVILPTDEAAITAGVVSASSIEPQASKQGWPIHKTILVGVAVGVCTQYVLRFLDSIFRGDSR